MVLLAKQPPSDRPAKAEVEVIIARSCLGVVVGEVENKHLELGSIVKVTPDIARQLALVAGAALFMDGADDPTPERLCTLTPKKRTAIDNEARMLKERESKRLKDAAIVEAGRVALLEKYGAA